MILAYTAIAFSGAVEGQAARNWLAETITFFVAIFVVVSNLYVLCIKTVTRVKAYMRIRKEKKARMKRVRAKLNALRIMKMVGKKMEPTIKSNKVAI